MKNITFRIFVVVLVTSIFSEMSFLYHRGDSSFTKLFSLASKEYLFFPQDNGKTYHFSDGKQFTVILNKQLFPLQSWKITCDPASNLFETGKTYFLLPPLYGFTYTSEGKGVCIVTNTLFHVKIHIGGNSLEQG